MGKFFYVCAGLLWFYSFGVPFCVGKCSEGDQFKWKNPYPNSGMYLYPGECAEADCRLEDSTMNVSLWKDGDSPENEVIPDGHKVTKINQVFTIHNVTRSDDGRYHCKACNMTNLKLGRFRVARDGKAFQTPEIINIPTGNVTYDSKVTMSCLVTGWYDMKWYFNEREMKQGITDHSKYESSLYKMKKSVTIERFTERNDGSYTCEVKRTFCKVWRKPTSVYLVAKKVRPELKDLKCDDHLIKCGVTKQYPKAEVTWEKCIHAFYDCTSNTTGWIRINSTSREESSTELNITEQVYDSVSYRCTARNEVGQANVNCTKFNKDGIKDAKARIVKKNPQYETMGVNVTIVCESNGSVAMEWKKGGKSLPVMNTSYTANNFFVTRKELIIRNFKKADEGVYECHVEMEKFHWRHQDRINITMKVKPKLEGRQSIRTIFKEGMRLKCELLTKPVPPSKIEWERCMCYYDKCQDTCTPWVSLTGGQESDMKSELTIEEPAVKEVMYRCKIKNVVGSDKRTWTVYKDHDDADTSSNSIHLIIILCFGLVTLVTLVAIAVILRQRKKLYGGFYILTLPPVPDYINTLEEGKLLIEQSKKLPFIQEWEFPRERVDIVSDLGCGAFGRVCLAKVIGLEAFDPRKQMDERAKQRSFSVFSNRKRNPYLYCTTSSEAAVKMLNENWTESQLSDLLTELKILIHVGQHRNVVNILAACTKGPRGDVWIIMEYCPYGNVSKFLRERRELYLPEWLEFSQDQNSYLSISDLGAMALQVANGMEFLISRKCVHRDLAARNVLIADNFVPKIADFGLARNMYSDGHYLKKNWEGLWPAKWMAIEALRDRIFSEKSDVWSFAIFLWEIYTMGGSPYPGIHSTEIFVYLCDGNRMKAPVSCPNEIYEIMTECWHADPQARPNFKEVSKRLANILIEKNHPWRLDSDIGVTTV